MCGCYGRAGDGVGDGDEDVGRDVRGAVWERGEWSGLRRSEGKGKERLMWISRCGLEKGVLLIEEFEETSP